MSERHRSTIRLTPVWAERLERLSKTTGKSRNAILHEALSRYIEHIDEPPASAYRMAQTTEYMQVVADLVVSREMPEKRDAILATVAQRLEQFHGAK